MDATTTSASRLRRRGQLWVMSKREEGRGRVAEGLANFVHHHSISTCQLCQREQHVGRMEACGRAVGLVDGWVCVIPAGDTAHNLIFLRKDSSSACWRCGCVGWGSSRSMEKCCLFSGACGGEPNPPPVMQVPSRTERASIWHHGFMAIEVQYCTYGMISA